MSFFRIAVGVVVGYFVLAYFMKLPPFSTEAKKSGQQILTEVQSQLVNLQAETQQHSGEQQQPQTQDFIESWDTLNRKNESAFATMDPSYNMTIQGPPPPGVGLGSLVRVRPDGTIR